MMTLSLSLSFIHTYSLHTQQVHVSQHHLNIKFQKSLKVCHCINRIVSNQRCNSFILLFRADSSWYLDILAIKWISNQRLYNEALRVGFIFPISISIHLPIYQDLGLQSTANLLTVVSLGLQVIYDMISMWQKSQLFYNAEIN